MLHLPNMLIPSPQIVIFDVFWWILLCIVEVIYHFFARYYSVFLQVPHLTNTHTHHHHHHHHSSRPRSPPPPLLGRFTSRRESPLPPIRVVCKVGLLLHPTRGCGISTGVSSLPPPEGSNLSLVENWGNYNPVPSHAWETRVPPPAAHPTPPTQNPTEKG